MYVSVSSNDSVHIKRISLEAAKYNKREKERTEYGEMWQNYKGARFEALEHVNNALVRDHCQNSNHQGEELRKFDSAVLNKNV